MNKNHPQKKKLKEYLARYGYMGRYKRNDRGAIINERKPDEFDDTATEQALRALQRMANLPVTGEITPETIALIERPRCGEIEFSPEAPAEYVLTNTQWDKTSLTYSFVNFTTDIPEADTRAAFKAGFDRWAAVSPLRFTEVPDAVDVDIRISFVSGDHGDGFAFDGPTGTLAHAFYPPDGDVHMDDAETWSATGPFTSSLIDIYNVAIHELGHSLGLNHSASDAAIMHPFYVANRRELDQDDIDGIQAKYGGAGEVPVSGLVASGILPRNPLALGVANQWETIEVPDAPPGPGFGLARMFNPDAAASRNFGFRNLGSLIDSRISVRANSTLGLVFPYNSAHQAQFFRGIAALGVTMEGFLGGTDVVVLAEAISLGTITAGATPNIVDLTPHLGADAGNVAVVILQARNVQVSNQGAGHPTTTAPIHERAVQGPISMFAFLDAQNKIAISPGGNVAPYILGWIRKSINIVRQESVVGTLTSNAYTALQTPLPAGFSHGLYYIESTTVGAAWELRPGGSTDDNYRGLSHQHAYAIVAARVNDNRTDFRSSDFANTRVWRLGHLRSSNLAPPVAPTLLSPANGATNVSLTPTLSWSSVQGALDYYVRVSRNTAFSDLIVDTAVPGTNFTFPESERLNYSQTLYYTVYARNANGFSPPAPSRIFTTQPMPSVRITSPSMGAQISGAVAVSATATGVGLTGVQFKINGQDLGAVDAAAPYSVVLDTIPLADGDYTLTAVVADAYSFIESAPVTVTVKNAVAIAITNPASGQTVSGTITVEATATGPNIDSVVFQVNGQDIATDLSPPYAAAWNTEEVSDGSHTLTAVANTPAGQTVSAPIEINVANVDPVFEITGPLLLEDDIEEENVMFYNLQTDPVITFPIRSASNYVDPVQFGSPVAQISKNGNPFIALDVEISHIGFGIWRFQLAPTHTDTPGDLVIIVTLSGAFIKPIYRHIRNLLAKSDVDSSIAAGWAATDAEPPPGAAAAEEARSVILKRLGMELRNKREFDNATDREILFRDDGQTKQYQRQWQRDVQTPDGLRDIRNEIEPVQEPT